MNMHRQSNGKSNVKKVTASGKKNSSLHGMLKCSKWYKKRMHNMNMHRQSNGKSNELNYLLSSLQLLQELPLLLLPPEPR
jgi:hypothetical protein